MEIITTAPQSEFVLHEDKYPLFVGGFGAGKTEALMYRAMLLKDKHPNNDFAWYAPTYDLIRMIAFPRWEALLLEAGVRYKLIKSPVNELQIDGCGKIIFRSMDNPQRIIGYQVAHSFFDELDTLKKDDAAYVWRQALARNRQALPNKEKNTMAVATTPEGFRFCYDAWERNPKKGYSLVRAPTSSNPHIPEDYIESLRDIYPENLLEAYLEGKFVNLTFGAVYRNFDRVKCGSTETIKPNDQLLIGQDFNVGNMASVIFVRRENGFHAVGELMGLLDTPETIRVIQERYGQHKIVMYPDASGKARKSVGASTSDIALLKQAGFTVRAKNKNPMVKDRVLSVNKALEDGKLWINVSKCPETARCVEQQTYDKNGEPDKTMDLDHPSDALGYPISFEMPIRKPLARSVPMIGGY